MKILHVVHAYHPSIGGSQVLIQKLSERLVADYGDEVTVFTTTARNIDHFRINDPNALVVGTERLNGVTVRRFGVFNRLTFVRMALSSLFYRLRLPYNDYVRTLYNGPIVPGLRQAIVEHQPDIVMATAFPLRHMYDALAAAQSASVPLVLLGALHIGDTWHYERRMIYRAIRQANAYVAHTSHERDYVIQRGADPQKVHVIGGGVDLEDFAQADGAIMRDKYQLGDAPVVGIISKQVPRKRFDLLIAAMQVVWQSVPHARLLMAGGRTPYSMQIETLINALPPAQQANITKIDDFNEVDKPSILAACDMVVIPTSSDSFGIAFVEAWACNRPVIGSRAGAIPSVIDESVDGLLAEDGDATDLARAILTLLNDPSLRAAMGAAGHQKVIEKYTWGSITKRVRRIYEEEVR